MPAEFIIPLGPPPILLLDNREALAILAICTNDALLLELPPPADNAANKFCAE